MDEQQQQLPVQQFEFQLLKEQQTTAEKVRNWIIGSLVVIALLIFILFLIIAIVKMVRGGGSGAAPITVIE